MIDKSCICRALALILALFISSVVVAEEGKIGRLPDGSAYRTNNDGYRIVDHIAELEVENDDLRRQVLALENALESQGANKVTDTFEETTTTRAVPRVAPTRCKQPDRQEFCQSLIDPLYSRISELQSQLITGAAPKSDQTNEITRLQSHIVELQNALMEGPSKERLEAESTKRKGLQRSVADLQRQTEKDQKTILALRSKASELQRTQQELDETKLALDKTIQALEGKLVQEAKLNSELMKTNSELKMLKESAAGLVQKRRSRAAIAMPKEKKPSKIKKVQNSTESISHARVEFKRKLKSINSLINERKRRSDNLRAKKKSASVSLSPLITGRGVSLDHLRKEISNLDEESPLASISKGLRQIEKVLIEDVQVLKRLGRI